MNQEEKKRTSQRGIRRPTGQTRPAGGVPAGGTPAGGIRPPTPRSGTSKAAAAGAAKPAGAVSSSRMAAAAARRTPGGGLAMQAERRDIGGEIGILKRRGISLAVKFSLCISALVLVVSALFGLVAIRLLQTKLRQEIILSGEQQILMLEALGRKAYSEVLDEKIGAAEM
ncbi:MAG: hypothetical protein N3A38_05860 [Planctomycetota bacterium]|nr:hypothetical protein [Planctomycetota bacterium]